jgi:hypothetical protein
LPRWAAERVAALSDARVSQVVDSGARVIGEPQTLRFDAGDLPDEPDWPRTVPVETAARGIEAVIEAALRMEQSALRARREQRRAAEASPGPTVEATSSRRLLGVVAQRGRSRLGRSLATRRLGRGVAR